jgi:hypothetical protein
MACVTPGVTALELDMAGALATAREMGAVGWAAADMIAAVGAGIAAGCATRRDGTSDEDQVNG